MTVCVCRTEESERDDEVPRDWQLWEDWTIPRLEEGRQGNGVISIHQELELGEWGCEAEEFTHCQNTAWRQRKKYSKLSFSFSCLGIPLAKPYRKPGDKSLSEMVHLESISGKNRAENKLGVCEAASKVAPNDPSLLVFICLISSDWRWNGHGHTLLMNRV